jgi:heterotetrameric sarcosine oxidase gamma subunit
MEGSVMDDHRKSALSSLWVDGQPPKINGKQLAIRELPDQVKMILRGKNAEAWRKTIETSTRSPLPQSLDEPTANDPCCLLIGHEEWLIASTSRQALHYELAAILKNTHASVFDASSAWITLQLSGNNTRALLARGCNQDFHPDQFKPGHFCSTKIIRIPVFIFRHVDEDKFDLYVDRSLAMDLWLWLRDTTKDMTQ